MHEKNWMATSSVRDATKSATPMNATSDYSAMSMCPAN